MKRSKNEMKTEKKRWAIRCGATLLFVLFLVLACAGCVKEPAASTEATAPAATEPAGYDGAESPLRIDGGATLSLAAPVGLKYTGSVDKGYLDALIAAYGADHIKTGLLFTATDNLTKNGIAFTAEALDACDAVTGQKYVKVESAPALDASGNAYRIDGTLEVTRTNYGRLYSAVAYVAVDGKILRYSAYSDADNVRSLSGLAGERYLDVSETKADKYQNAVTLHGKTVYSPYTAAEYAQLPRFCTFVTAMSYNLAVYDSPSGGAGWEGRNPLVAMETVKTALPDIVGFQEVNQKETIGWDSYLADLAAQGGYTRVAGRYTTDNFEKNEIFFKTDKFTMIAEGTFTFKQVISNLKLSNPEGADNTIDNHGRTFHYVKLETKGTGRKVLVVDTHLHYGGTGSGHEEDDKVRRYEISALIAWLQLQVEEYPDQIVLGDMNAHYKADNPNNGGTRTMTTFLNGGFAMTSLSAKVKGDVGGTLAVSDRKTRSEYVFDHVLTKGALGAGYYTVVDNPNDVGNSYPSDHIPVMAEIYFLQ